MTVFSGATGGVLYSFTGSNPGDGFGTAIAGAGDVNGDSFADILIGAPLHDGPAPGTAAGIGPRMGLGQCRRAFRVRRV